MSKLLLRDSFVYALSNAVQKMVPFLLIPVITELLGKEAFKVYDISFTYAYLFGFFIIVGQDAAASVLYFREKDDKRAQDAVTAQAFLIQMMQLLLFLALIMPILILFRHDIFPGEPMVAHWWTKALWILPGYVVLNYCLNILTWQRRRGAHVFLCSLQSVITVCAVLYFVRFRGAGIDHVVWAMVASTSLTALVAVFFLRRRLFNDLFPLRWPLVRQLYILGLPFAATAVFHQLLPSLDRYFLLHFGYGNVLAPYLLAVKLGGLLGFGISSFVLAFTPYSMERLHESNAEAEMSSLLNKTAIVVFFSIPVVLLFKDVLIELFANKDYNDASNYLPFFFYGWAFDLFSYFSTLGVYKSSKSYLVMIFFALGVIVTVLLNICLIPVFGLVGAAVAFALAKAVIYFISLIWLRHEFRLRLSGSFWTALFISVGCVLMLYFLPSTDGFALAGITSIVSAIFLFRQIK